MTSRRGPGGVRPRWSWRWALVFALLVLALHEMHELAHTWTGRLLCGEWGERDFNVWSLAEGCATPVPTAMGPLFTYAVVWLGAGLLWSARVRWRHLGVTLLFAANPFARLLTVALGGGDELVVARTLFEGPTTQALWIGSLGVVLLITAPPLWAAWRALAASERRIRWFTGLLLVPTLLVIVILLLLMNTLLEAGVGARPVVLGEPILLLGFTAIVLALLVALRGWLVPAEAAV